MNDLFSDLQPYQKKILEKWEFVTLFFTEKGAKEFIERNKHRHDELRVYVDSAHRNEELQEIIKFLENYNE